MLSYHRMLFFSFLGNRCKMKLSAFNFFLRQVFVKSMVLFLVQKKRECISSLAFYWHPCLLMRNLSCLNLTLSALLDLVSCLQALGWNCHDVSLTQHRAQNLDPHLGFGFFCYSTLLLPLSLWLLHLLDIG